MNLPAMQETQFQSLGRKDTLEERMATHSRVLAWGSPWTEEPAELYSMGDLQIIWGETDSFMAYIHPTQEHNALPSWSICMSQYLYQ